jgi:Rrf2 family protein
MQNVLQISKKIDYALRAMVFLASLPAERIVSFRKIAEECRTPKDFQGKIMKILADKKLVVSVRGSAGGYRLARPASEISFLDVVEGVEGTVALNSCIDDPASCPNHLTCTMSAVWQRAQAEMIHVLRQTTLEDVLYDRVPEGISLVTSSK